MFRILIFLITLIFSVSIAQAQTPEEKGAAKKRSELNKAELKSLFAQLGADSYKAREAASITLLGYGRAVIPALKKLYEESKDPEVKGRAFYIAEKIQRDRLLKKGKGYLGVRINTGTVNPMGGSNVEINSVDLNLPAAKVGLKKGDRILQINKTKVKSFDELKAAITSYAAGDKIAVVVQRGQKRLTFYPILAKLPDPKKTSSTVRPQIRGNLIRPKIQLNPNNPKLVPQGNAAILRALENRLKTMRKAKNPNKQQIARIEEILKTLKAQGRPNAVPVLPPRRGINPQPKVVPVPKPVKAQPEKDKNKDKKKDD
ncbi:MAG: PDZ domain-containing protein [Planctomycetota bacterium]|nr:PDZ domain-containing protein [Planctomycetota bacterium]